MKIIYGNRRDFLRRTTCCLLGALLAPLAASIPAIETPLPSSLHSVRIGASQAEAAVPASVRFLRQLVTADTAASRYIAWQSDVDAPMEVELVEAGRVRGTRYPAAHRTFSDGGETTCLHEVTLTGLDAHTHYRYRIRMGIHALSDWHTLPPPAAPDGSFTALLFPDAQCSGDYGSVRAITRRAREMHPTAALTLFMGDQVDNGESVHHWRGWSEATADLIADLPAAVVMGNHETYDLQWQVRIPHAHLAYFPLPANGTSLAGYFASFDIGACHFIVLNTQQLELEDSALVPSLTEEALTWLEADVAQSMAAWNIVLMHKDIVEYDYPDLHDARTGDISRTGRLFMPHFDRLGIDLVCTAHQHTYRRLGHIRDFAWSETGPYYIDTGNCGNCYYDVPFNDRLELARLPQPERGNYLTLSASRTALSIDCYLADGTLADSCVLRKI